MARRAVSARSPDHRALPTAALAWRVAWIAAAAVWVFAALSLGSFDSADAPSHVVSLHNQPTANLCGAFGAVLAYWSYWVVGIGSWVILAGAAVFLGVTVTGRDVGHPVVRAFGLCLMALAVSSMQRLIAPDSGVLSGAPAGLIAEAIAGELHLRFSGAGTFLILLGALAIGAIVAADRLVLAAIRGTVRGIGHARTLRETVASGLEQLGRRTDGRAATPTRKSKRKTAATAAIDPDAGGIGATEAFDPEDELVDEGDEYEYDDEEDDDYEYEDDEAPEEEEEDEDEDEHRPAARRRLTAAELRAKIAKLPVRMGGGQKKEKPRDEDIPREVSFEGYQYPTLELLADPQTNYSEKMEKFVRRQAEQLEEALQTYGIDGEVSGIESGPSVTLYSVELAPGTKVAKINAISSDLARTLRAQNVRIVPNMVGKTTVGIEVPNIHKEKVRLKELMSGGHAEGMNLPMFLGKDASGEPLVADLTSMPHMLIAGTTGSGKSVCMNTVIMSWLYTKRPDELKSVLVDPKMVELSQFADIPHLMCPVVTESHRATMILEWAVHKMEERYELLREGRVRDVSGYNALTDEEREELFQPGSDEERARIPRRMPFVVFVIDELADLILTHREVEQHIVRIAQKARAVGIHLIVATQRPQANVVTGLIKSNMPSRVSFKVASGMDSRIVLDQKGAELLLGQGDMLFLSPHTTELRRAQGTLVTDGEIRKVTSFLKEIAAPTFERSLMAIRPGGAGDEEGGEDRILERDPLFDQAVRIIIESGRGSVSLLQRRLSIGYTRASRLVDQMGLAGILGEHRGSVARDVLITLDEWEQMRELEEEAEQTGTLYEAGDDEDLGEAFLDDDEAVSAVHGDHDR